MLSVVMLSVVMVNAVMLSVMTPHWPKGKLQPKKVYDLDHIFDILSQIFLFPNHLAIIFKKCQPK
jgi:hypothetical protein